MRFRSSNSHSRHPIKPRMCPWLQCHLLAPGRTTRIPLMACHRTWRVIQYRMTLVWPGVEDLKRYVVQLSFSRGKAFQLRPALDSESGTGLIGPGDPAHAGGADVEQQEIKRRTKTGCLTCRKRRIKVYSILSLFTMLLYPFPPTCHSHFLVVLSSPVYPKFSGWLASAVPLPGWSPWRSLLPGPVKRRPKSPAALHQSANPLLPFLHQSSPPPRLDDMQTARHLFVNW